MQRILFIVLQTNEKKNNHIYLKVVPGGGLFRLVFFFVLIFFSPVFVQSRAHNLRRTFKTNDVRGSGTNSEPEMAIRAGTLISFSLRLTPSVTDANFKRGA